MYTWSIWEIFGQILVPDLDSEPWAVILSNHVLFSLWKKWIYIAHMLMVLSIGRSSQVDLVQKFPKKKFGA